MSIEGFRLGHMLEGRSDDLHPGLVDAIGVAPEVGSGGRYGGGGPDVLEVFRGYVGALVGQSAGIVVDRDQAAQSGVLGSHGVLIIHEFGLVRIRPGKVIQRVFHFSGAVFFRLRKNCNDGNQNEFHDL